VFLALGSTASADLPSGHEHARRPYAGSGAEAAVNVSVGISQ
jgi:hypothetical protein